MQKITAILLAIIIAAGSSIAGGFNGNELTTAGANPGDIFPHFGNNFGGGKGVVEPYSRLVAKTYFLFSNGNYVPQDSATYKYGANRGGSPSIEEPNKDGHILFNDCYVYRFVPIENRYSYKSHREQQFDHDNRVKFLTFREWETVDLVWKDKTRYEYFYDNNKMIGSQLQIWYSGMWTNSTNSVLTYDIYDRVTDMQTLTYAVAFDYASNSKNLTLIEDKIFNVSTQQWENNERKEYVYNSNNEVIEYVLKEWSTGSASWIAKERWLYTYNTKNVVTKAELFLWSGSSWVNDKLFNYMYSGTNEIQKTEFVWSSTASKYVESKQIRRTFNSYDQPETYATYSWNGTAWMQANGDERIHYYYEYYDPTSVKNIADADVDVKLYPVPASSIVNIELATETAEDINIAIVDMTGKTVYRAEEHISGAVKLPLNVNSIPDGNYMLLVDGENLSSRKRMVVMH